MSRELKIDPEIQAALDPLKPSEKRQLLENIQAEGIRDPLVVWKGTDIIVDGHNRYKIAMEFDFDFDIVEMDFEDTADAIDWLRKNQLGKRNLTENQQTFLIGDLYNRRKRRRGGDYTSGEAFRQVDGKLETAETVAQEIEVSPRTVERAGEFAQVLEVIREKAGPDIVIEIKRRPEKIPTYQLKYLAAEVEHNPEIIEQTLSTPPKLRAKTNSLYRGLIYNQNKPKRGTTGFSGETVGITAEALATRFKVSRDQVLDDGRLANVITKVREADEGLADWLMETPGVPMKGIVGFNGDVIDVLKIRAVRSIMLEKKLPFTKSLEALEERQRARRASKSASRAAAESDREVAKTFNGSGAMCFLPNVRLLLCEDCNWAFDTYLPEPGPVSCPYCKGGRIEKREEDWRSRT